MTRLKNIVLAIATFLALLSNVNAQSIWQQRDERFASFYQDSRAHALGDLLTVVIEENTNVRKRDQRALDKSSDGSFNLNFAGASSSGAASSADLSMAGDSSRAFDGNSQYRVAQEFSDQIAVRVVRVLRNGDLVIRGRRKRIISDEKRELLLTGVVRPIDINANNTVRSQFVADLNIEYVACGSESHFTNQGWVARAINRVWPF